MRGKSKTVALVATLLLVACASVSARAQGDESARRAVVVREKLQKIGTGVKARVRIELSGGRKLEGYVGQLGEDHFYLIRTDGEKGTAAVVAFDAVESLERRGDLSWRDVVYRTGVGAGALLGFLRSLGAMITPAFPAAP